MYQVPPAQTTAGRSNHCLQLPTVTPPVGMKLTPLCLYGAEIACRRPPQSDKQPLQQPQAAVQQPQQQPFELYLQVGWATECGGREDLEGFAAQLERRLWRIYLRNQQQGFT